MKKFLLAIICLGFISLLPKISFAYTINGQLDDWGVTPGLYGSSDWDPNPGIYKMVEDQTGGLGSSLGPGYGGQRFDAEAMYITYDSDNLYYAIVTGLPPTGGNDAAGRHYIPGDIAINFAGEGYEYGIGVPNFYNGHHPESGALYNGLTASDWNYISFWPGYTDVPMKIVSWMDGRTHVNGEFAYTNYYDDDTNPYNGKGHWVIEGSVPLDFFGTDWGKEFTVSWTMTCGNDILQVTAQPAPEPATMTLFGLGILGLFGFKKKIG